MDKSAIRKIVETEVVAGLMEQTGRRIVPVAVSNRHIHLSRSHVEQLFGAGYQLTPVKPLSQPGQFACEETLTIKGSKGSIAKVRVLGPERPDTQIEISATDSFKLGVPIVVHMSGEVQGTAGCTVTGPKGTVELQQGLMISRRHLHISSEQAKQYRLQNGDVVKLRFGGIRPVVLEDVLVRAGDGHELEVHVDMDEANAALIKNGDYMEIVG